MGAEEFAAVCRRVHELLRNRCEAAKKRHEKHGRKSERLAAAYLQTAKEYYAFTRLMELCATLGNKVNVLQEALAIIGEAEALGDAGFVFPVTNKKSDLN